MADYRAWRVALDFAAWIIFNTPEARGTKPLEGIFMIETLRVSPIGGNKHRVTMVVRYGKKRMQVLFDVKAPNLDPKSLHTAIRDAVSLILESVVTLEMDKLPLRTFARYVP